VGWIGTLLGLVVLTGLSGLAAVMASGRELPTAMRRRHQT
jgi:hypothetical protein